MIPKHRKDVNFNIINEEASVIDRYLYTFFITSLRDDNSIVTCPGHVVIKIMVLLHFTYQREHSVNKIKQSLCHCIHPQHQIRHSRQALVNNNDPWVRHTW
jgi:hypothetical protein